MTIDCAMIFAAGFGTRMGALTATLPKPMLPLGGRPMIDHSIELLRQAGVTRLFANTHYLPETLETHLAGQGVITLRENQILETGGGLKVARDEIGDGPVITINPDALWIGGNPVGQVLSAWSSDMTGLLMLTEASDGHSSDFSLEQGKIARNGRYRYTGLQIIRTDALPEIEEDVFSLNVYWDHLMSTRPLHGLVYDGEWADIGTEAGLKAANKRVQT